MVGREELPIKLHDIVCGRKLNYESKNTGRPPGLIFGMWGYLWPGSDKFESWNFFHTFDGVMT